MTTSGSISRSAFERARSVPNAEPNLAFRFWHFPNLNAERASGSSSVQMRAQLQAQPPNAPSRKGKGKKNKGGRYVVGAPPPATRDSALRIVGLGMVPLSIALHNKLVAFLEDLQPLAPALNSSASSSTSSPAPTTFVSVMIHTAQLENKSVVNDFELMLGYIEAAFYIQWRKSIYTPGSRPPGYRELAQEVKDQTVNSDKISNWVQAGTRLAYLAACSSMYILPLIAVCGWRPKICKEDFFDTIEEIGYLLCAPHEIDEVHILSRDCGEIVRRYICPQMVWIEQMSNHLGAKFVATFPPDSSGKPERILFSDVEKMSQKLRSFNYEYWTVPEPDQCWKALKEPLLAPILPLLAEEIDLSDDCVAEEITVTIPVELKDSVFPVNSENRDSWSKSERKKAAKAKVVQSLDELKEEVKQMGEDAESPYLCIPTEIMDGKVLTMRDAKGDLIASVITNISNTLPHLPESATTIVSAIMEGEVYPVDSSEPGHRFCATHKVVYNRYAEQGNDAPKDVHPNLLRREGVSKVNYQRGPRPAKEMKDEPEETELLNEFLQMITVVIEVHLRKLFPEEHFHIQVFASRLPLNQRSPAYPFAGYVLNIGVSSDAHRDEGDKIFCVIIPFGEWEGGEFGLHEPRFLFRLRAWDAIIFQSCKVTHFNMDIKGVRCSLVLHTDKEGDNWVHSMNNWTEPTSV
ncbi:hypothetical protein B0H19DRAFT_1062983 [Mycena capillaripes]|nr:hypothetical protein B0H19DRAFT_1062983 [Mycena capillaripes]